jgi:predicted CxxxxCH...CXXCH cytochrome family protein
VPTSNLHASGTAELTWGALATTDLAKPAWDKVKCSGSYCHGSTLQPAASGGIVNRSPNWTKVDGSQASCGDSCHTNPPGGTHPQSGACEQCHTEVIAKFTAGSPPTVVWGNAALHVDGKVQVKSLNCTSCHGDAVSKNPAPPKGTKGETLTSQAAVGAHAQHLGVSGWHRAGLCSDCHADTADVLHSNSKLDLAWNGTAALDGAAPIFDPAKLTCASTYCHGSTLTGPKTGGTVKRTPLWTQVDNSYDACGSSCHTNPPAAPHPQSNACASCHTPIKAYNAANPAASTWNNAALHVDGKIDLATLNCTTCHGDAVSNDPSPPKAVNGATVTGDPGVGAHAQHLGISTWHRDGACTDCHQVPASNLHTNGVTEIAFGAPGNADGALPAYDKGQTTCTGSYCHGTTLQPAKTGATAVTAPKWNKVDGSQSACGSSCHTNPPGGTHSQHADCKICHTAVIAAFDTQTSAAVWFDRVKHINGTVESNKYHDLGGWTSPKFNANHHGSKYFVANQQKDEHNAACTQCHGADLLGGTVGVSCNTSCHNGDWRSCDFCHGTKPGQSAPPIGVANETAITTLGVGRHTAHLTASATHTAIACPTCHLVPATGDVSHALGYVFSANLATPGHHGDVTFSGAATTGMGFNVNATSGNPVTARGTCSGGCHSNGKGGAPAVTAYWAGGNWTKGSCTACHGNPPKNGEHSKHMQEGLTCLSCHPAANGASHMNGKRDVNATITGPQGGSVKATPPTGTGNCATAYRCTGSCHGENHQSECW